jgi:DNA polymerase elongation subunit (family B)
MNRNTFFTYNWFVDDSETDITAIRVYGIGENNENICVRINDFTPYVYIELPTHIPWNDMKAQLLGNKIDEIMGKHKPLKKCLMWKQKLYGAHLNEDGSRKKFPYLFCSFSNKNDYKSLSYTIQKKNIIVSGIGAVKLRMHEQDADPILQLTVAKDLPTSGWITFVGNLISSSDDKITLCDLEYKVNWKNMKKHDRATVGLPKIMGFDIEVNSSNPSAMPKAEKPEDKIFQISCIFSREGSNEHESHLLTLGDPIESIVGEEVIIHRFLNEAELIVGFTELIRKENPNVIVGYNILNFDIPYMIERSKRPGRVNHIFDTLGFHKYNHAKEKTIVWSSSAYKNQEFKFLEAEGRLFIDLLPLVKRDFKMDNYKLKTVSDFFIGETKDPLSVKGIFKCYRIGTKKELDGTYSEKAKKAISIVGKYCVQDSVLVVKLMEKLQTWVGLTEMATVCQVQPFSLFTQGQQIKVYSQVYRYCYEKNIVVEKDGYICKDDERYTGAHVFPPVPGIYDRVVPFDFASLKMGEKRYF